MKYRKKSNENEKERACERERERARQSAEMSAISNVTILPILLISIGMKMYKWSKNNHTKLFAAKQQGKNCSKFIEQSVNFASMFYATKNKSERAREEKKIVFQVLVKWNGVARTFFSPSK